MVLRRWQEWKRGRTSYLESFFAGKSRMVSSAPPRARRIAATHRQGRHRRRGRTVLCYGQSGAGGFAHMRRRDFIRILRGTKPGDIPVEQPSRFVINLTTAKVLGLTIAASFILRANEVIE
jgi:hypothetical protein